jgi:hypothetical protein
MSRFGGIGGGARGLLRKADEGLKLTRAAEVSVSSFAFGVLQGRFKASGGLTLILPVDLLAGAAFHILGAFSFTKPYSHHLHAIGDGALASFFTTTGYRVGERWASGGSFLKGMSGMLGDSKPVSGGSSIADKELSSLVRAE